MMIDRKEAFLVVEGPEGVVVWGQLGRRDDARIVARRSEVVMMQGARYKHNDQSGTTPLSHADDVVSTRLYDRLVCLEQALGSGRRRRVSKEQKDDVGFGKVNGCERMERDWRDCQPVWK